FADCRDARRCWDEGGAAGASRGEPESAGGGRTNQGAGSGDGSGGVSASGGAMAVGELGGGAGVAPVECGDVTCTDAEPYCDVLTSTCVECLNDQYCAA